MYNAYMTFVDIDNIAEPLLLKKFDLLSDNNYPYCLIGFELKNFYDQERLKLKAKYKAKDVVHTLPTATDSYSFFRGIKLELKPKYNLLIRSLQHLNTHFGNVEVDLEKYKQILDDNDLSCDECYGYLRKGVYPIDGKCLSIISNYKHSLEHLYEDAFDLKIPVYQSFSSFTIFILCNDTIFSKS